MSTQVSPQPHIQAMDPAVRLSLPMRRHVLRQLNHWEGAAARLDDFEATAGSAAWSSVERYVGVALRQGLLDARNQLQRESTAVRAAFSAVRTEPELERVANAVALLRKRYLQTELLVDFYVSAVRARGNPEVGLQLRACDVMAERAIHGILDQLALKSPPILTYFTTGIGASILRIGTKLWDGSLSPIAAIRLTYHNRFRTTSLLHECGHQVAGVTGWNAVFAQAVHTRMRDIPSEVVETIAGWTSEIAADSVAFAYSGYAAVVALSDVVAGRGAEVFRFLPGDPHPISYLRVMLGVEMCRRFYGMGPWDELADAWRGLYPLSVAPPYGATIVGAIMPLLPRIVEVALLTPMHCFQNKTLAQLVDPQRVSPSALRAMEASAGPSAFTSSHWVWQECLRLTALTGLRYAVDPEQGPQILKQQEDWMIRLGGMTRAAV